MEAHVKLMQVASSLMGSMDQAGIKPSDEVLSAWHDVESALNVLGAALWRDAQTRATSALSDIKRRVGDAELELEMLVSRMPAIGPQLAMELHQRTHRDEDEGLSVRPSNELDAEDAALLYGEPSTYEYVDHIGSVHMA